MTTPGPKPKPRALRTFESNLGNAPINKYEPIPQACDDLIPPEWLSADCEYLTSEFHPSTVARIIWDRMAEPLSRIGVLTNIDKEKLTRYCYLFALWLKCKAWIDKFGTEHPVYSEYWGQEKDKKTGQYKTVWKRMLKKMQEYPAVGRMMSLSTELGRYEQEFGIGAASRTRIQTIVKSALEGGDSPAGSDFNYAAQDKLRIVK
jgi:P27 family predicted phage terminase small subunit